MSIAVFVLTTCCVARNSGGAARQTNEQGEFSGAKSSPQSVTFYSATVMHKHFKMNTL
jgi:hypothetical protein